MMLAPLTVFRDATAAQLPYALAEGFFCLPQAHFARFLCPIDRVFRRIDPQRRLTPGWRPRQRLSILFVINPR
jgi:hypothetical protein